MVMLADQGLCPHWFSVERDLPADRVAVQCIDGQEVSIIVTRKALPLFPQNVVD